MLGTLSCHNLRFYRFYLFRYIIQDILIPNYELISQDWGTKVTGSSSGYHPKLGMVWGCAPSTGGGQCIRVAGQHTRVGGQCSRAKETKTSRLFLYLQVLKSALIQKLLFKGPILAFQYGQDGFLVLYPKIG